MALNRGGVSVLRNANTVIRPAKMVWAGTAGTATYGLSTLTTPNPGATSTRFSYLAGTVATGGKPITGYRLYKNGVPQPSVPATNLQPTISGLVAGASNTWEVTAISEDGEGPKSDPLTVIQATVAQIAPNPPTGGTASGTPTSNSGTVTWTASTTSSLSGYNVYVNGSETASYTTSATTTSQEITGLPADRANTIVVKAVKGGVESTGLTITLTTSADTSTLMLARADDFVNTVLGQAKVSYTKGTHNYTVAANKTAIQNYYKAWGMRSYRERIPTVSDGRTAVLDFMKAVYPTNGTKYQGNIGSVEWIGKYRTEEYTEQEVYASATEVVMTSLEWFVETWLPDTTLGITDLSEIIHGIGGPNEVNPGNGNSSLNWDRNARIYAEVIWNLMRRGRLWNGVYTKTTSSLTTATGTKDYWDYTVTKTGTFEVPTGTKAKYASYPTYFANVPILAPSMRADVQQSEADALGGPLIPASEAAVGTRLYGKRRLAEFVEIGNQHQYQQGMPFDESLMTSQAAWWTPLMPNPGFTPSRPWEGRVEFTEGGYNHMGFYPDGSLTTESRDTVAGTSPDGSLKCPPWIMAAYLPGVYASMFKKGWKFHLFEMMDDDDTVTATTRSYGIQAYYGHVWTPNDDPTTWTPLASFNCIRRLNNLLKDRSNPKVAPTFNPVRRPMTVTVRNGVEMIELNKANGDTYYLVWRKTLPVFKDYPLQTNPRIAYTNAAGTEVRGLPPEVNVTMRLDHASGTRQVDIFRPNKARWINAAVASPTVAQSQNTASTGHDDTTDWSGATPTPDTAVGAVNAGATFTFPVGYDLLIVRVKG